MKEFVTLPVIESTLCKGRGMVGYFNSSIVGVNEGECGLHACQRTVGVPENALTQDVKTRWRSTHDMCNSLRINQEALLLYDVKNQKAAKGFTDNRFSLEDWEINNQTVAVLAPLANASMYLEGKTYATSNLVLPSILGCIHLLHEDMPVKRPWNTGMYEPCELREEVREARQLLYEDMVDRWVTNLPEGRKRFYYIATICDPRQKGLRSFPGVSAQERETALNWFEAEYLSLYAKKDPACVAAAAPAATTAGSNRPQHPQHGPSSFIDFMVHLAHAAAPNNTSASVAEEFEEPLIQNEARRYLSMPDASMSTDVLEWWAMHQTTFPNLSVMAQQYLSVPATSASAERLFSIAGRVFSDLRQRMEDVQLEALMWARINCETRSGH